MYVRLMNTREQGDRGEMSAADWFVSQGVSIALPFGHSPDWDLAAELAGHLVRVQVKTSNCFHKSRWVVAICTRGGNQSWNGTVKRFSRARCDYLFVHVGDGRRWLIPSDKVEGGSGLILGGPKYAKYEIDSGRPLPRVDHPESEALESAVVPGGAPELESRAGL
jgi:PD-(D/E)XK nuclease superfamily protein